MSKPSQTSTAATAATTPAIKPTPGPATTKPTRPTGQKVSLERGKATHKKNPGKRPKQGG